MIELYRPGSGTEGAFFMERWCAHCVHDRAFREEEGDSCPIAARTMILGVDDPDYPREWREDGPSGPRCTAFTPEVDDPVCPQDPAAAVCDLFSCVASPLNGDVYLAGVARHGRDE